MLTCAFCHRVRPAVVRAGGRVPICLVCAKRLSRMTRRMSAGELARWFETDSVEELMAACAILDLSNEDANWERPARVLLRALREDEAPDIAGALYQT